MRYQNTFSLFVFVIERYMKPFFSFLSYPQFRYCYCPIDRT